MIKAIDKVLDRAWRSIGELLCRVTGQSNFFVAQCLALLSLIAVGYGNLASGWWIATILYAIFLTRLILRLVAALEQDARRAANVLSQHYPGAIRARVVLVMSGLVILPTGLYSWSIGYCLSGGALYLATQNRTRRDSAFKRALQRLKSRQPRIAVRSPLPIPTS